jgi:acid phosphatase
MRPLPFSRALIATLVGLVAGFGLATVLPSLAQSPRAAPAYPQTNPPYRGLDGNLYMQTAAEYRACCYQAYNLATQRLNERLVECKKDKPKLPLAVVFDLDETVLDNAGFEAMLLRSGLDFDLRLWKSWEQNDSDKVALIPGALEFITACRQANVTPVYISNRDEEFRKQTKEVLNRLKIGIEDEKQLKLATRETGSSKHSRRLQAEKEFAILLYLGDQLRDFHEMFLCSVDNTNPAKRSDDPAKLVAAIAQRKERVDANRDRWGKDWIVLPNSSYGEWTKPFGRGVKDLDLLVPQ